MSDENQNETAARPKQPVYNLEALLVGLTAEIMRNAFD